MRFGPLWPDRVARLFPKGSVRWEGLVHERPVSGLPTARLKGHVLHHTYPDFRTYVEKQALYARLWARGASARGASATPFKAFTRAFLALLKMSVLKLGLLDGPAGWCLCWYYSGAYTLGKYLLLADMTGARHEDGGGGGAAQEAPDGGGAPEARAAGAAPEAPVTLAPEAQEDEAQGDGERLAGGVAGPGNGAGGG
jgi:hypothetical protein